MVCFVPSICLSIRKSCQRCDCSELGTVRNWVDHCMCQQGLSQENNFLSSMQRHRCVEYMLNREYMTEIFQEF